uniref:FCP1 homology domain-containing protein n=1 Tax=Salix viminalis TaxID=40686 RepID=A0A6N2M6U5_SALVM
MPSLKMKTNLNMSSLRETKCLSVCQKSNIISKKSSSQLSVSQQAAASEKEPDKCVQKCQDDYAASSMKIYTQGEDIKNDEAIDQQDLPHDGDSQFLKQPPTSVDSGTTEDMESIYNFASNLETIFSPVLELIEVHSMPSIFDDAGSNNDLNVPGLGTDDSDDNRSSCDYQTCNISDFFISEMIITNLPFDGSTVVNDFTDANPLPDYKCAEPSMLFDVTEECMMLPFLEETAKVSYSDDMNSCEEAMIDSDNSSLYLAINQIRSCDQESELNIDSDQAEDFDPLFFIKNLPELSDVVSNFRPSIHPKESCRRKSITLVLDLDETLVHSTLEHCDDADFTFTVFFNMKEHIVYVKQRPHLHTFLERVAEMFEVVIFTASQSIYAAQLLDILDPDRKLISRRLYRESCIFSDGSYTKDLTVLGVDLAKVAIIDNSPQVFRLQVNNGIPIKSWFTDPSDCALISLLPFLETLGDADDVRPIIAKRFGNKE